MGVTNRMLRDELEETALIPAPHDDHRRTRSEIVDREQQRRCVIHRPGDKVRPAAVHAERPPGCDEPLEGLACGRTPRTLHVEARVADVDRQEIARSAQVFLHPAEVYAAVRPGERLPTAGKPTTVEVAVVQADRSGS